jgi:lipoprotein-anchoring transpeptidase ErfK/SrfK
MPFMQRIDQYGIALHAGYNPGRPASHGCIRLPAQFAAKLYGVTDVGSTVMIGA